MENLTYEGHLNPGEQGINLRAGHNEPQLGDDIGPMGLPIPQAVGPDDRIAYPLMLRRLLRDESIHKRIILAEKVKLFRGAMNVSRS